MTTTQPQVSVIIPAYNAAWCIRHAIDSVLAQSFRDFELIVVNDGSTDGTLDALRDYGDSVRIVSKPNGGLSSARNAGIAAARGEYVAFLDADDGWLPEKLMRQVALLDAHPETGFCSCATSVRTPTGEELPAWECPVIEHGILETIFRTNGAVAGSGSAVMARRALFAQVGGFDETLRSLEDIDMWMRLGAVCGYACIPERLAYILKHPESMSRNLDVMRASALTVMCKNRSLLPPAQRGSIWRAAYAATLADYAKWAYRSGRRGQALRDVMQGLALSPFRTGRLMLGLLRDMVLRRSL